MVKFECPHCGYVMQTAQYLNGKGHCLKCNAVVATTTAHPLNPEWSKKMRTKFDSLNIDGQVNKNGIGTLDFEEMKGLLLKGNPAMTDDELKSIFEGADTNGNGVIEFTEFLWFLYGGQENAKAPPAKRAPGEASSHAAAAPKAAAKVTDLDSAFKSYCGGKADMDGKGFAKLCKDSKILDKSFSATDADLAFSKVCPKGARRINMQQFEQALKLAADKKGKDVGELVEKIVGAGGPTINATETVATRFHDDKSTYTGSHKA
jgi:hypothetical protein